MISTKEHQGILNKVSEQQGMMTKVAKPTPTDVLLGRGKPFQSHSGNVRLRKIIETHKERYANSRRFQKLAISEEIVKHIKDGVDDEPGRFLKQLEGSDHWVEVPDAIACDKVSHGLRGKDRKAKGNSRNKKSNSDFAVTGTRKRESDPFAVTGTRKRESDPFKNNESKRPRVEAGMIPGFASLPGSFAQSQVGILGLPYASAFQPSLDLTNSMAFQQLLGQPIGPLANASLPLSLSTGLINSRLSPNFLAREQAILALLQEQREHGALPR